MPKKTHCLRGHERIPGNLTKIGACRLCAARYKKGPRKRKTHCKHGHPRIPENLNKRNACRICVQIRSKAWAANHPEGVLRNRKRSEDARTDEDRAFIAERCRRYRKDNPAAVANTKLLTRYGITWEERNRMIDEQDNRCGVCTLIFDNETRNTMPFIDHNHTTKKVRGLLCHHCNAALGHFADDPVRMLNAIEYLRRTDESIRIPDWWLPLPENEDTALGRYGSMDGSGAVQGVPAGLFDKVHSSM